MVSIFFSIYSVQIQFEHPFAIIPLIYFTVKIAVDHELLYVTFPRTHNFMAEYLIQKELYDEAENILLKMMNTEKLDAKYFVNLHKIDVARGKSQATEREHRYTLEYGLEL